MGLISHLCPDQINQQHRALSEKHHIHLQIINYNPPHQNVFVCPAAPTVRINITQTCLQSVWFPMVLLVSAVEFNFKKQQH